MIKKKKELASKLIFDMQCMLKVLKENTETSLKIIHTTQELFAEKIKDMNNKQEEKLTGEMTQGKKWVTVKQLSQLYPFSTSAIRNMIFFSKNNGMDKCIARIGRKVLINTEVFEHWFSKKLKP